MELIFIITALIVTALINIFVKQRVVLECLTVVASGIAFFGSVIIALKVASLGIYSSSNFFLIDSLGAIVVLVIGSVGFITAIYSISYLRQETAKNIIGLTRVRQYLVLLNIFLAAMFLATAANNPIFAWVAIEATTLSTAFLISFYNKPSAIEGAWKYLIINSVGLLLGFFGTLLYFTSISSSDENGFVSWQTLIANASNLNPLIAKIAFIFVLIGYGTKVGLAPMHTWKPDAYSKAPNPIGALLSGALLPVAFFVILKLKMITDASVGSSFSQHLLVIFGILSIAIAALIMFSAKNYKRLLAYSSIENAGIIALGFGFGGLGIFGATLHMIYHSFTKAVLFFSSGNLLLKYSSAKISNVRGALSVIPVTSTLFITGFLIVTGTPPFGMFFSKMNIFSAGIQVYPAVTFAAIFFMAIVFIGFLKHATEMFFSKEPADIEHGENSAWLIIPPIIFLIIIIVLGFYVPLFLKTLIADVILHY